MFNGQSGTNEKDIFILKDKKKPGNFFGMTKQKEGEGEVGELPKP